MCIRRRSKAGLFNQKNPKEREEEKEKKRKKKKKGEESSNLKNGSACSGQQPKNKVRSTNKHMKHTLWLPFEKNNEKNNEKNKINNKIIRIIC